MTLNLESGSDLTSPPPERAQAPARPRKPFWQRPWVVPLWILVVIYLYTQSKPFLGVPKEQQPLQPHDNFPPYYTFLVIHMIGGTIAMLAMCLQVWPWLRQHHAKVHRVSGRIYLIGTLIAVSTGLVVVWWAPKAGKTGALCMLLFWGATSFAAYRAVRRGDYNKHRRYMLYSFAVAANNMWAAFALIAMQKLNIPIDPIYQPEASRWIPWVGNLMLVQWWLYRTARRRPPAPAPSVESIRA